MTVEQVEAIHIEYGCKYNINMTNGYVKTGVIVEPEGYGSVRSVYWTNGCFQIVNFDVNYIDCDIVEIGGHFISKMRIMNDQLISIERVDNE